MTIIKRKTLESTIEAYFIKTAKEHNFLTYKFTSPSQNGVPDRIIIGHGITAFVELKRPDGKLRKLQTIVMDSMKKHGAVVYVVNNKKDIDILFNNLSKE